MGHEIVYCATCQSQIRGADLQHGKAFESDGRVYCSACAPESLKNPPPAKAADSTVFRRAALEKPPKPASTSRMAAAHETSRLIRRESPSKSSSAIIGTAVAVLVVLVIIVAVMTGSPRQAQHPSAPPPEPAAKIPTKPPPPARTEPERAPQRPPEEVIAEIEKLAGSGAEPETVLMRCEEVRSFLGATPFASRLSAVETRAKELKIGRDRDRQVNAGLEQIRSLRETDPTHRRRDEVLNLLKMTRGVAGPRQAEVDRIAAEYDKEHREAAPLLDGLAAWYRFASDKRLGRDDSGNRLDADEVQGALWSEDGPGRPGSIAFSGAGAAHLPLATREDLTIAFWMKTTQAAKGGPQWWSGTGLVDAEVAGQVPDFGVTLVDKRIAFGVGVPDTTIFTKDDVADGKWRHVAATWTHAKGDMKLYLDGALQAAQAGPQGPRSGPPRLTLGRLQTDINPFTGHLADVRVYARALPESQVRALVAFGRSK